MEKEEVVFVKGDREFSIPTNHIFIQAIMVEAHLKDVLGLDEEEVQDVIELLATKYKLSFPR